MLTKSQMKATHHENKLGAGAKARKHLHGKAKIPVVMHEFKHGTLHSGSGAIVKSHDQAVAIAMHEAGMSKDKGFFGHSEVPGRLRGLEGAKKVNVIGSGMFE